MHQDKSAVSLYNKYMNEPNTQQDQSGAPPARKMSSRATNFLMMGSNTPAGQQTGPLEAENYGASPTLENEPHPGQATATHPGLAPEVSAPISEPKRTGVQSSTIYPAQRPSNQVSEPQSAARTNQLEQRPNVPSPSPAEKERIKEEKIDRLADRITDVLKRISDIKTGMLNPNMDTGQKIQMMAGTSPAFSKFLGVLLTQLEPVLLLMHRINQKLVEKNLIEHRPGPQEITEQTEEEIAPAPPEKVSFLELSEKNIIFCDNRKRPLYSLEQMRGKHGYTASEEVIAPMILENIIQAFHEVAPKAKAIPTPTGGIYANIPMDQVMEHISEEEIMRFLGYVQRFPRGYVGKNFRITESFAGWVVSGTPDD
ncbi:MAG: hypothetical protein ACO1RX_15500 [Candidatus Sericytochromatia bacterium]